MLFRSAKVGITRDDRIVAKMLYKSNKPVIVAVNNDENPAEIYVPLPIAAEKITDLESGNAVHADNGKVKINLEAGGSVLLKVN